MRLVQAFTVEILDADRAAGVVEEHLSGERIEPVLQLPGMGLRHFQHPFARSDPLMIG